jgi:RHS repeat-associated protein
VTDQLGTPRLILDQTGSLANIKRHDYLPFGEELFAGTGARTTSLGYTGSDGVRQQFTQKERDIETGLIYSISRYYSSTQGRFTSPDLPFADQSEGDPQSWNLYTYVGNNPITATDPSGLWKKVDCDNGGQCWQAEDGDTWETFAKATGYSVSGLKKFFVGETITSGQVFDVGGYEAWNQKFLRDLFEEQAPRFEPAIGGGLRDVTKKAAPAVGGLLVRFARWLGLAKKVAPTGKLIGSLNGLTQAERSMVQELLAQGKTVQIIPRATGKTADFIINGAVTEFKTLQAAGPNTLKNAIESASQQGPHILVDARNVMITQQDAILQIVRAQGNIGGLQGRVTVLTRYGTVTY